MAVFPSLPNSRTQVSYIPLKATAEFYPLPNSRTQVSYLPFSPFAAIHFFKKQKPPIPYFWAVLVLFLCKNRFLIINTGFVLPKMFFVIIKMDLDASKMLLEVLTTYFVIPRMLFVIIKILLDAPKMLLVVPTTPLEVATTNNLFLK
jgi:hypothetical protein